MVRGISISASGLRYTAMICMVIDHLRFAGLSLPWLVWLGRLAFPIFAFQISEGFRRTSDPDRYALRLFAAALISEIPFDLMLFSRPMVSDAQNVVFTLLLGLGGIRLMEWGRQNKRRAGRILGFAAAAMMAALGEIAKVDYGGIGVATVLLFYVFGRDRKGTLGQLAGMLLLHGFCLPGAKAALGPIRFSVQLPAVLALVPIRLYNGEKGPGGNLRRYGAYLFYPLHMLVLYGLRCLI